MNLRILVQLSALAFALAALLLLLTDLASDKACFIFMALAMFLLVLSSLKRQGEECAFR